jgi:hypothetical protein
MAKLEIQGRLGNNLIQFISAFLFCEKHKINLYYDDMIYNYQYETVPYRYNLTSFLNREVMSLVLENKQIIYEDDLLIHDDNFFHFYNEDKIEKNIIFRGYFMFDTLLEEKRETIKKLFGINYDNSNENNLFVHYRLGDINNSPLSLPLGYFEESISKTNFNKGYISSDSINDEKCKFLIEKYNLEVVELNPWETILFGKNFGNIVLSEGSFSYLIGYFSNSKNVFYNKRPSRWGNHFLSGLSSFKYLNWD